MRMTRPLMWTSRRTSISRSHPNISLSTLYNIQRNGKLSSSCQLSSSSSNSSSFLPPVPPPFTGQPVYPDIDIHNPSSQSKQEAWTRNQDPNAVFVVTGASRGIGLQMVKDLWFRAKGTIVACCRSPDQAHELQTFRQQHDPSSRIQIVPLDLEKQETIQSIGELLRTQYQSRVDILLNVAGILGDGSPQSLGPERSISKIHRTWMEKSMAINMIGPIMLCQEISSMMVTRYRQKNNKKKKEEENTITYPCILVNVSARVGSISDNNLGGWYSYRCSKAALNQATRTMSHELKRYNIHVVALHPGTTDTDLSKPFQGNVAEGKLFPVEFTVDRLLRVTECMESKHSGGLYDWAGKALPF